MTNDPELQRFRDAELQRFGNKLPTLDQLICDDHDAAAAYKGLSKDAILYWLDKAERCYIAVWLHNTRGKALETFAKEIELNYKQATKIEKLHRHRAEILDRIDADKQEAIAKRKRWKYPSLTAIYNWFPETKREAAARTEPPEITRLKKVVAAKEARILELEAELAEYRKPIEPELSSDSTPKPNEQDLRPETATPESVETLAPESAPAPEPDEDHAQANLEAALARTVKISGPYHLSAERAQDVIYRENEEPETVTWFVEHFKNFDEAVAFAASLSQEIPAFEEQELFSRMYRQWDWYDEDAETSWSIWIGQPPTMISAIENSASASPREEVERKVSDTDNPNFDEMLAVRDEIIKEIDARLGWSDEANGKLAEEQIERTRMEAQRATECEHEVGQRAVFEAAIRNAPNNYQKGKARKNLREFEVECAATYRIFTKTMDRFDARSVRPPRRVRKNLSMLGLEAFPTVAELSTAYRQQAAALHKRFGSDTAQGFADEFHARTHARDELLAILRD